MAVWIVAGLLAMAGALTYAELSAMMPRAGGEYVLIREAYGRLAGFLFGWMRFFIGNTGGMAALAFGLGIFLNVRDWRCVERDAGRRVPLGPVPISLDGIKAVAIVAIVIALPSSTAPPYPSAAPVASVFMALKVAFVLGIGTVALLLWSRRLGAPDDVGGRRRLRGRAGGRPRGNGRRGGRDDGGDVGVQRLERDDLRRRRGPRSRPDAAARADRRAWASSRSSTCSST